MDSISCSRVSSNPSSISAQLDSTTRAGWRPENTAAGSVENDPYDRSIIDAQHNEPEATTPDAIMAAARQVVQTLKAAAIVSWTSSGSTGLRAARERPSVPIIALTPVQSTGRRLALAPKQFLGGG